MSVDVYDAVTWTAIAVLGPGAVAVFVWFLRDLRDLLRPDDDESTPPE